MVAFPFFLCSYPQLRSTNLTCIRFPSTSSLLSKGHQKNINKMQTNKCSFVLTRNISDSGNLMQFTAFSWTIGMLRTLVTLWTLWGPGQKTLFLEVLATFCGPLIYLRRKTQRTANHFSQKNKDKDMHCSRMRFCQTFAVSPTLKSMRCQYHHINTLIEYLYYGVPEKYSVIYMIQKTYQ